MGLAHILESVNLSELLSKLCVHLPTVSREYPREVRTLGIFRSRLILRMYSTSRDILDGGFDESTRILPTSIDITWHCDVQTNGSSS